MKATFGFIVAGAVLLAAVGAGAQQKTGEEKLDPETKARLARFDKGPSKIDVSTYPPEMKNTYKLFTVKCAKCHTIARPINCDYALEDEWERYIKRMMRRAGKWMSPEEGKRIFEFVTYDSKTRKKEMYDRKLKESGAVPGS